MSDKNFVSVSMHYNNTIELAQAIMNVASQGLEVSGIHHFHNEPEFEMDEDKYFSEFYVNSTDLKNVMSILGPKYGYSLVEA